VKVSDYPLNYRHWTQDELEYTRASNTSDGESINFPTTNIEEPKLQTKNGGESAVVVDHPSKSTQKVTQQVQDISKPP
jgi:uncharacterized sporulation protein YeaH/YhbH (DUF444 family)